MQFWISSETPLFDTTCSFCHRRLSESTHALVFGGLGGVSSCLVRLGWVGLGCVGLGCVGLGWVELGCGVAV